MEIFRKRITSVHLTVISDRRLPLLVGGVALSCVLSRPVLADVKIVTEVSVSGNANTSPSTRPPSSSAQATPPNTGAGEDGPQAQMPGQTVTIYYKGNMARRETAGGLVMLYDGAANKAYALNPIQKTYSAVAMKDVFKWLPALDAPDQSRSLPSVPETLPEGMHREIKVEVDKTGLQHTVNDVDTLKYTLYATQRISMEAPSRGGGGGYGGGGGGGGRRGGGGRGGRFPGGGGSGGSYPPDSGGSGYPGGSSPDGGRSGGRSGAGGTFPSAEMQGDLWLADAAVLPGGVKSPLLPILQGTVPDSSILKSVCDKISKLKCVPLSTSITARWSSPSGRGNYGPPYYYNSSNRTTITMQVKSITQAPLDDALFQVPAEYQKAKIEAVLRRDTVTAPPSSH